MQSNDIRIQNFINSITANAEFAESLKSLAQSSINDTGDCSFALFTTAMVQYMRDNLKQDFRNSRSELKPASEKPARAIRAQHDGSWRGIVGDHFSGIGNVWVFVPTDMVQPNLQAMRDAGLDVDMYESLINAHGKAWMRFMGTRMHPDTQEPCALFWIWPDGSKGVVGKMHESAWVYVPKDVALDTSIVEFIGMTPYKAGLENEKPKNFGKTTSAKSDTTTVSDATQTDDSNVAIEVTQTATAIVVDNASHIESIADELDALEDELFND